MAFVPAFHECIRVDIARAEPASCARETDRFALVPFRVVQHVLVEHVSLQHVVADVAAPSFCAALALDAVFGVGLEAFGNLFHASRGAGMAGSTS